MINAISKLKQDAQLNSDSPILRITRAGDVLWGSMPGKDWTVFSPNHSTYEPLETGSLLAEDDANNGLSTNLITVLRVTQYLLIFRRWFIELLVHQGLRQI